MDFNAEPFWDDFEASNGAKEENYMRILFRPGYAVQARELTQIQSILQNQIKSFGDHIFKSGSPVLGGHITVDSTPIYLKLQPQYNGVDVDLDNFSETIILNFTNTEFFKKRAKVIQTYDNPGTPTLVVKYLRGNHFDAGEVIQTPTENYASVSNAEDYTGSASVAHIDYGIFYVNGYFVQVQPSSIILDAYGVTPSYRVGLEIDEQIIDESADTALLDPAQESFNYQAPGAHRYKYSLNLAKRSLTSVDDTRFFELLRIENGVVTKKVDYPIYSEIDRTLARRAADQSGDYVVTPFGIKITPNTADVSNVTATVELGAGKAYVNGYEYISVGPQKLNLDKARVKASIVDYDLSLEYGNYLYANNFFSSSAGIFDITQIPTVDIHCVPSASIDLSNYDKTLMGTARMVNFDHNEGSDYIAYLSDLNISSKTITLTSGTGNPSTLQFPSGFSSLDGAYANVIIRIVGGTSVSNAISGVEREIISYTGSTRTATLNKSLPTDDLASGDKISLVFQSEDIESIAQPDNENPSSVTDIFNSMDISASSRFGDYNFTKLIDTNIKSLIFPLPELAVANTPFSNTDFYHKIVGTNKNVIGGEKTVDLNTGESFYYGTDGNDLSSTQSKNHFIVVVTEVSNPSSPYTVGEPIVFGDTYGGFTASIHRENDTTVKIRLGSGNYVSKISYVCSVKSSTSPTPLINVRTKTAYPTEEFTSLRSTDSITNATHTLSGRSIDSANGIVWFTNYSSINKIPDGYDSLYMPDVYSLVKVYDSGDPNTNVTASNAIDITNKYYLDSGQNLAYYDHSKLKLRPGTIPPKGRIAAIVRYYKHNESKSGYFNAYSYPTSHYENNKIPIFKSSDGSEYNLRDCVDFRPSRTFASATGFSSMINPMDNMELSYEHYLPRIDKVILTQEDGLKVLQGIPSKFPAPPTVNTKKSMELYTLSVPAYTSSLRDILITESKNKRYTMKDIGLLEQRIENLEYYTALSLSEKVAKDKTVSYADGTQKEKYGIIVDNFSDFSKADFTADDFLVSIDQGVLAPYVKLNNINMELSYYDETVVRSNDKLISLPYTEEVACKQLSATSSINPQAFVFGMFNGTVKVIPEADEWFSDVFQSEYLGELFAKPGSTDLTIVTAAQAAVSTDKPLSSGYTPYTSVSYTTSTANTSTTIAAAATKGATVVASSVR